MNKKQSEVYTCN